MKCGLVEKTRYSVAFCACARLRSFVVVRVRGKMSSSAEQYQRAEALVDGKKINEAVDLLNVLGETLAHVRFCSHTRTPPAALSKRARDSISI